MMRLLRLIKIIVVFKRYGLFAILQQYHKTSIYARLLQCSLFFITSHRRYKQNSLAKRTRLAFEHLGPVFVKFGQLLSTRPDIIPEEYSHELSKLQNQVTPFAGNIAQEIVKRQLKNIKQDFATVFVSDTFSTEAVASASVAQVHQAVLAKEQQKVAIKILRPNIAKVIDSDIQVLRLIASIIEYICIDGKRLQPQALVTEFAKTIHAELNLLQEASNAIELKRLHKNDPTIVIPQVFLEYCTKEMMILEWMDGTPINDLNTLERKGIDLKRLSHNGVTIFYTQVFDYGFFHADMHSGNILCDDLGRYVALDFGIIGSLSANDKRYLAINILAFFNRDYKKVAQAHVESGWAPADTHIEELEHAIRGVCDPIFNKPLKDISFGQVLIKLFQVSRQFNIAVQPQLILLQKTIVSTEGLGRMLNPDLDLWVTAKPILVRWMKEQISWRGFLSNLKNELPYLSYTLPKLPRYLMDNISNQNDLKQQNAHLSRLVQQYKTQTQIFATLLIISIATLVIVIYL